MSSYCILIASHTRMVGAYRYTHMVWTIRVYSLNTHTVGNICTTWVLTIRCRNTVRYSLAQGIMILWIHSFPGKASWLAFPPGHFSEAMGLSDCLPLLFWALADWALKWLADLLILGFWPRSSSFIGGGLIHVKVGRTWTPPRYPY